MQAYIETYILSHHWKMMHLVHNCSTQMHCIALSNYLITIVPKAHFNHLWQVFFGRKIVTPALRDSEAAPNINGLRLCNQLTCNEPSWMKRVALFPQTLRTGALSGISLPQLDSEKMRSKRLRWLERCRLHTACSGIHASVAREAVHALWPCQSVRPSVTMVRAEPLSNGRIYLCPCWCFLLADGNP